VNVSAHVIGTHVGCQGQVVLVARPQSGYRLCMECGKRGGEVSLIEEQPNPAVTEKATISRKVRAFQYVSKLKVSYVITEKEQYAIEDFAIYLQMALIHYGLDLDPVIGGLKVIVRVQP